MADAQLSFNEAALTAIKQVAEGSHASDKALLELINALVTRTLALEEKVEMLMELHRAGQE